MRFVRLLSARRIDDAVDVIVTRCGKVAEDQRVCLADNGAALDIDAAADSLAGRSAVALLAAQGDVESDRGLLQARRRTVGSVETASQAVAAVRSGTACAANRRVERQHDVGRRQ